jgi:hypothetical protein
MHERLARAPRITPERWHELEHEHRREVNRIRAHRPPQFGCVSDDLESRRHTYYPAFHESRKDVIAMVRLDWEEIFVVES